MRDRLESYEQRRERAARQAEQRALFRRRQGIGLLLAAAAVLGWRLLQTPLAWLFPPGWWRLW